MTDLFETPEATAPPSASPAPPPLPFTKRLKHAAEYAGLLAVAGLLSRLSRRRALRTGRALGRLLNRALASRREIARKNIRAGLPGFPEDRISDLLDLCAENLGAGIAEFVQMPRMSKEDFFSFTEMKGLDGLRKSYAAGKGVLLVTAHYGAWELGTKAWPLSGFKFAVVARRVKNPWVNGWMTRIRSSEGTRVILARDGVRESVRWLRQGGLLAVLIDHRVTEGNLKIPFLGRPAFTTGLPAILALRYKIPVHMARSWREEDRVRVEVEPALDFSGLEANEPGIAEATRRMSAVVEGWIRDRPEAWLWIHNRWK